MTGRSDPDGVVAVGAMPTVREMRVEAERIARRRVASGETGADMYAHLLDLLDLARNGYLVPAGGAYSVWERASGFADLGPEVA